MPETTEISPVYTLPAELFKSLTYGADSDTISTISGAANVGATPAATPISACLSTTGVVGDVSSGGGGGCVDEEICFCENCSNPNVTAAVGHSLVSTPMVNEMAFVTTTSTDGIGNGVVTSGGNMNLMNGGGGAPAGFNHQAAAALAALLQQHHQQQQQQQLNRHHHHQFILQDAASFQSQLAANAAAAVAAAANNSALQQFGPGGEFLPSVALNNNPHFDIDCNGGVHQHHHHHVHDPSSSSLDGPCTFCCENNGFEYVIC